MAKATNNYEESVGRESGLRKAFDLVDHHVGGLFGIA